jgi:Glycosidases
MVWKIGEILAFHPVYQATMLYNLLGSHDTPRIIEVVSKDKTLLKLLINLLNLLPGSLAIYYGDEIGLEGGRDPDNRRPMRWDQGEWDAEVLNIYLEAIALRRKHPGVRYGFTRTWLCGDGVLVVERWLREDRVIGLFNLNEREADVSGCFEKLFEEASHRDYADLKPLPRHGFIIVESDQRVTFHDV